jgi:hypothetical protein
VAACVRLRHQLVSGLNAKVRYIDDRYRIICPNGGYRVGRRVAQHLGDFQNRQRTFQAARINNIIHFKDVPRVDANVHLFETRFERIETRFNGDVTICTVTRRTQPVKTDLCLKLKPSSLRHCFPRF